MTRDDANYTYHYDYENRITEIRKTNDTVTVSTYTYDALGRRIVKNDAVDANNSRRYYYNDNWQVSMEYNAAETISTIFVYGNYVDEVIGKLGGGTSLVFYLYDHLYSPAALCNVANGQVLERYEYDAYGKPRIMNSSYGSRATSSYSNPYMFTGRNVDRLDNGNLWIQYNRNRYYDYDMGRWLTRDPLGYVDGINLYQYVSSCPMIYIDSYGLGVFAPRIRRIEQFLSVGEYAVAAEEARELYKFIAANPNIFLYPTALDFMRRWLSKVGGEYKFSSDKVGDIIDKTRKCIAYRLKKQVNCKSLPSSVTLNNITAKNRTDYFYALGWFQVKFKGNICCKMGQMELEGTFAINDIYDWQDPAGKYVEIGGDRIYDRYAALVEDYGYALRFKVSGSGRFKKSFDTDSAAETDCNPAR